MSEVDQDQVDPAMEMETAGTEVTETASNLNYWSGLLVQLTNIYDEYSPPVVQLLTFGSEMAMVFGGVMPYIPQYLQIQSKQTTQGFSLYVCLALLMANTLRIILVWKSL